MKMKKSVVNKIVCGALTLAMIVPGFMCSGLTTMTVQAQETDYCEEKDGMAGKILSDDYSDFIDEEPECTDDVYVVSNNKHASVRNPKATWRKVIDVSRWQGNIDWNAVKASGVEGAFIRVGGRDTDGDLFEDSYYKKNIEGAIAAGIKVGAYMYSEAINADEAVAEANFMIQRVMPYKISLPLVIDYERCGGNQAGACRLNNWGGDSAQRTATIEAFCRRVESCGYSACVYANKTTLKKDMDAERLAANYKIWVAQYKYANPDTEEFYHDYCLDATSYDGTYDFWQFTSKGTSVRGVSSQYLDLDWWYDDGTINGKNYSAVFDATYYAQHNPDVVAAVGYEPASLLKHFIDAGMNERRKGRESFDVVDYAIIYSDLRSAFGKNWKAYYEHYMSTGKFEGRVGTIGSPEGSAPMYRMYNPNSGEHFYTANKAEVLHLWNLGWNQEGIGWYAPTTGAEVYRLYNSNAGDHHYTMNAFERDMLIKAGWNYEGVCWHSGGNVALQRAYNPNAKSGSHHYSTNGGEINAICRMGWKYEGIAWYAVK